MEIKGKTRIFKNETNGSIWYNTSIANKLQDGNYEYMSINVQFPKDTEIENKTTIDITKGFISFYKDKNGMPKPKIIVQEWNVIENNTLEDLGLPF